MIDLRGNQAMKFVNQLSPNGEFWLYRGCSVFWNCQIKCEVDGLKIEVSARNKDINDAVFEATDKFMKAVTPIRAILQPALEAPRSSYKTIESTAEDLPF